jgi:integrase
MEKIFNESVAKVLTEGNNLSFYLNNPNKRGWGVLYARLRVGEELIRVSTSVRVKKEFWSVREGRVIIPHGATELEIGLHTIAEKHLLALRESVDNRFFEYLCSVNSAVNERFIVEDIRSNITHLIHTKIMPQKKNKRLLFQFREIVGNMPNEKSQRTMLGILRNFEMFLKAKGVEDSIGCINMSTLRSYREWLINDSGVSAARGKHCLNYIFTLCNKLERKEGLDFMLDKSKIEPIKETRSVEERKQNSVALTEEELKKIENLEVKGALKVAKDMFLLQCYCGFRFEDMGLLLQSGNIQEIDGVKFSVFKTQKKDITSHTPLNNPNLYPQAWEIFQRYVDKCPYTDREVSKYNQSIKEIAKLAGLDREITITSTQGEKKSKKVVKLYERISSHSGRHTFITNAIRYKGLTSNVLIHITGHSDTKMIDGVYSNLQGADKMSALNNALKTPKESQGKMSEERMSGDSSPVDFARWLVRMLGIDSDINRLSLPQLVEMISGKKGEIISKYGRERYEQIKAFLGVGLGQVDKGRLHVLFCKVLGHNVRLIGNISPQALRKL